MSGGRRSPLFTVHTRLSLWIKLNNSQSWQSLPLWYDILCDAAPVRGRVPILIELYRASTLRSIYTHRFALKRVAFA